MFIPQKMNIKRRKSQRWFLENQKTKQLISLYVGDTKILRNRNVYNSTHCTIDIFKDRTIRIHEIVSYKMLISSSCKLMIVSHH